MSHVIMAYHYFQIFPDTNSSPGYIVRTALLDIVDIFEVNRKECARLLLEYLSQMEPGTFKPKPGVTALVDPVPGKDWQLESTIIEVGFPNPVSNELYFDLLGYSPF